MEQLKESINETINVLKILGYNGNDITYAMKNESMIQFITENKDNIETSDIVACAIKLISKKWEGEN